MQDEVDFKSLQDLLENALDPILVVVGESPVFANDPALALTGYDREELLRLTLLDLIHPDELEKLRQIQPGPDPGLPAPGSFYTVLVCKDRSLRPVEITALKTTWHARRAAFLVLRDTAQRAEEIAHLREIERNLRFIIENSNDGIVVISEEGRILYTNRSLEEKSGYAAQEATDMPFALFIDPDDLPLVQKRFSDRISGRPVARRYEMNIRTKAGAVVPVEVRGMATTWRDHLADVVIIRDLTERKRNEARLRQERDLNEKLRAEVEERRRVEEALRASEKLFRDVAQASGEYIWELDAEGRITFITDRVREILGYDPEELLGRSSWYFDLDPASVDPTARLARLAASGSGITSFEKQARTREGNVIWLHVRAVTVRDENGTILGFRGTSLDITEQKADREALRRRDAILEAVSFTAELLFRAPSWEEEAGTVLERLGRAAGVARTSIYRLESNADGVLSTSRIHSWSETAEASPPDNEIYREVPVTGVFPDRWVQSLERGQPVRFCAADCPESIARLLERIRASSVLVLPVLVRGELWGILSLAHTSTEAPWQANEVEALQMAGNVLGAVIQRGLVEDTLKRRDEIMKAVGFISERLLGSSHWEAEIGEVLGRLGRASASSRAVVHEIYHRADGEQFLRWRHIWSSPDWPLREEEREREEIPADRAGFVEVLEGLRQGLAQIIPQPDSSRQALEMMKKFGATAVLIIPVLVHGRLWGALVFSERGGPRTWSTPEIDALRAAAEILGAVMERQSMEEALRQSEEKYRILVEGTDQVIATIDGDGVFHFANLCAHDNLGMPSGSIVGRTMWDLFPAEHADRQMRLVRETLASGHSQTVQSRTMVGGRLRWYETRALPLLNSNGRCEMVQLIASDVEERKEAEQQILSYQERLRSLTSELALTEQRERRRIAAELHDRIGQTLAVSKIKLSQLRQTASPPTLRKSLDELWGLIDQTIQDTRSLTFELSPPVLYELGLEPALEWLTERTRHRHGLATSFTDDGRPKPLGLDLRGLLFQAAQELLLNVAKHAAAGKASVSVSRRNGELRCEVADDGCGFDVSRVLAGTAKASNPPGFGLFSIRERLGHLGGRLEVESTIGRGTRAVLWAPLLEDPQAESGEQA